MTVTSKSVIQEKPDHVVTNSNMPSLAEVAVFERKIIRIRFARFYSLTKHNPRSCVGAKDVLFIMMLKTWKDSDMLVVG